MVCFLVTALPCNPLGLRIEYLMQKYVNYQLTLNRLSKLESLKC